MSATSIGPGDLLDTVGRESTRIAAVASSADLALPVPACEGWTIGEVARHLGSVTRRVVGRLRDQEPPAEWEMAPPAGTPVVDWYAAAAAALLGELSAHPADEPCDTWWDGDRSYGFWRRRMAHELTIHRVDVEQASGRTTPITRPLALDGIDEALVLWLANPNRPLPRGRVTIPGSGAGVVLVAGDVEWTIDLAAEHPVVRRGAADHPAATVSAPADVLYRWLWGRASAGELRVDGDHQAVTELRSALRQAMS